MRAYEKTHSWISFKPVNFERFDYRLWMSLGEAASKCEHLATVPLQPKTAKKLHSLYLAKGIRATAAIEGNTLSEEQVSDRLDGKDNLPQSQQYLGQEIDNISKSCNIITNRLLKGGTVEITTEEIKEYNRIIFEKLPHSDEFVPGEIRRYSVGVASYRGAPTEDCEFLLDKMCDWINKLSLSGNTNVMAIGILKAIIAHIYIAWIHPFGDGNGRTARLIELKILMASNIPTPAAHLLSNHYNLTRDEYYRQLDYTTKLKGDIVPFIRYAVEGFVDGLKKQIEEIQKQHLTVSWENYIHDQFRDKVGEVHDRRKFLVLDLTKYEEPVPLSKIHEVSARVAIRYAKKGARTVGRDIKELLNMNLIKNIGTFKKGGFTANKETMLSFLPIRRDGTK
ncbi:MAG: Fic family protein [Nitrospirae bacterium]|nr:Fic family protein [Nitrospirota bacterium]